MPSKPLNLTVLEVTSTTITIGWRDPENLNGAIVGYRVFYIHQNQTYFATVRSGTGAGEMIRYDLCDLSKYTIHSFIHPFICACIFKWEQSKIFCSRNRTRFRLWWRWRIIACVILVPPTTNSLAIHFCACVHSLQNHIRNTKLR